MTVFEMLRCLDRLISDHVWCGVIRFWIGAVFLGFVQGENVHPFKLFMHFGQMNRGSNQKGP